MSLCSIHHPKLLGYPDLTHTRGKQSQAEMKLDHFCGFVALFSVQIESLTKHSCTRRKYDNHFSSVYLRKERMCFHDFVRLDVNMLIPREGWTTGWRRCLCGAGFFGHFWHLFRLIWFGHVWCCEAIGHKFPEVSNCRGSVPACLLMIGDDSTLPLCPDVLCFQLQSVAVSPCLTFT